jgi:predicted nucleic acid-binding protein
MRYVLDTFALMAYLRREKNFEAVRTVISETLSLKSESFISIINLGELYYMQSRKSGAVKAQAALRFVGRAGIVTEAATNERVLRAAQLKARCSMSYADAFAATLAEELNATLVTGDREYEALEAALNILWI